MASVGCLSNPCPRKDRHTEQYGQRGGKDAKVLSCECMFLFLSLRIESYTKWPLRSALSNVTTYFAAAGAFLCTTVVGRARR